MARRATEVFTPGTFPIYTYVERSGDRLESALRDALSTPGQIVSLSGPSKSGKTVLVEKVIGRDSLIVLTGAGIQSPDDIWNRVLDWFEAPQSRTAGSTSSTTGGIKGGIQGTGGIPFIASGTASVEGRAEATVGKGESKTYGRNGLAQVVKEIAGSEFVVMIDDFHYMPRDVQIEAAKAMKEAVRQGIRMCTAEVRHRGDDVVRANPELRGRVRALDLKYWQLSELISIAERGFAELHITLDPDTLQRLAVESAGSPQLMQQLCLNLCFILDAREAGPKHRVVKVTEAQCDGVFEVTSTNTDFRSLVDVLDAGPKTRGTERKMYSFHDGSSGDVYRCVLKAMASDPPRLAFPYDDLLLRTAAVCKGEAPVGSSVTTTCIHMSRLAQERFPNERAIDWDEDKQVMDMPDPYLLFYLRWSGRLKLDG